MDEDLTMSMGAVEAELSWEILAFHRDPSYHGEMKASEAIRILKKHGGDCYLTRYSPTNHYYVLTVLRKEKSENFRLESDKNSKAFKIVGSGKKCNDLRKLLKFYRKKPINHTFNGIGDYVQSPDYEPPEDDDDDDDDEDEADGIIYKDLKQAVGESYLS